ncbi:MAG: class I SAM-dependent methyltransferase [Actinomycetota bacterium]
MPIKPPSPEQLCRVDPVYLTEDDLEELSTFTGMTKEVCRERVRSYSTEDMASAWRRVCPKTPKEILEFYQSEELYVWELAQWHASSARNPYWNALEQFCTRHPPGAGFRRVYDFGCGIGTDALFLATRGYDVTIVDVDGPASRFARHRFARHRLPARFVESRSVLPEPDGLYDAVVCFDVFEHLPDPLEAARRLVAALRPGGILVQQSTFGDDGLYPCHLPEGVRRFGGTRWHMYLAGLGLRAETSCLYRKVTGWERLAQRVRFKVAKRTGMWVVPVGR